MTTGSRVPSRKAVGVTAREGQLRHVIQRHVPIVLGQHVPEQGRLPHLARSGHEDDLELPEIRDELLPDFPINVHRLSFPRSSFNESLYVHVCKIWSYIPYLPYCRLRRPAQWPQLSRSRPCASHRKRYASLSPGEGKRRTSRAGRECAPSEKWTRLLGHGRRVPTAQGKTSSWRASARRGARPRVAFDVRPLVYKQRQHLPRGRSRSATEKVAPFPAGSPQRSHCCRQPREGRPRGRGRRMRRAPWCP